MIYEFELNIFLLKKQIISKFHEKKFIYPLMETIIWIINDKLYSKNGDLVIIQIEWN